MKKYFAKCCICTCDFREQGLLLCNEVNRTDGLKVDRGIHCIKKFMWWKLHHVSALGEAFNSLNEGRTCLFTQRWLY